MFNASLRPAIRSVARRTQARALASSSGPAAGNGRSLLQIGTGSAAVAAAAVVGYSYYANKGSLAMLSNDKGSAPSVRDSVLDQPSLKEHIHKRGGESDSGVEGAIHSPTCLGY